MHQLQRDAGPMDCRLDNTDVHVGEEKSLTSARNQTGDIAIARMCCFGPTFIANSKIIFYKRATCSDSVRHENDIVKLQSCVKCIYTTQKELRMKDAHPNKPLQINSGIPRGVVWSVQTSPQNSKVLTKLSRISSSVENTSIRT
jgi:hypothetical protein